MQKPLVSVLMTTFHHAPYIRQAVESILQQECDFPYELILRDDASTDSTPEICRQLAAEHPDKVRFLSSPKNEGWRKNYRHTFDAAQGEYVAYCDGDDWWTDNLKLQMQVDLMRKNPSCGMCYTRSMDYYQDTHEEKPDPEIQYTDFDRLAQRLTSIPNCTTLAKRELVQAYYEEVHPENHPEWMTDDAPMWLWFAAKSEIKFLPKITATHRKLSESVSHKQDFHRRLTFCDSVMDISLWMDKHYAGGKNQFRIQRKKSGVALWVHSYNGSIREYLQRWGRDLQQTPRLLFCPEGLGLLVKKILFRRSSSQHTR